MDSKEILDFEKILDFKKYLRERISKTLPREETDKLTQAIEMLADNECCQVVEDYKNRGYDTPLFSISSLAVERYIENIQHTPNTKKEIITYTSVYNPQSRTLIEKSFIVGIKKED